MLIEFTVGNYLSIKDKQTLRMDASSITEYQDRLIDAGRYKLLRSAVIYGANASGKSNVLKAMATMRQIITTSAAQSSTATIPVEPFLLSTETEHAPSYFEMLFLLDGIRYRYGFEVDKERIHAEWLFEQKKLKEKALFVREGDLIEISASFKESKGLEERTRGNALFLAVGDQFRVSLSTEIAQWFFYEFISISGILHDEKRFESRVSINLGDDSENMRKFIKRMNFGFSDIKLFHREREESDGESALSNLLSKIGDLLNFETKSVHTKFDERGEKINKIYFDLDTQESSGTVKVIDLVYPVFRALREGGTLLTDEIDAKLHPLLTKEIINLFNNPETNPKGAQLIFATHDTNLLSYGQFRRDQIYFTEKDKYGATSLYSLVEYKGENGSTVRKDRSFEKDYIEGRYGAIPYIGDFSKLFS